MRGWTIIAGTQTPSEEELRKIEETLQKLNHILKENKTFNFPVKIQRTKRRKRISISVNLKGEVLVRAPLWLKDEEILTLIKKNEKKILADLAELKRKMVKPEDGQRIWIFGKEYTLRVEKGNAKAKLDGDTLTVFVENKEQVRSALALYYKELAQEFLPKRVELLAEKFPKKPTKIEITTIKYTETNAVLGQCTADGVIRLDWRLVQLPTTLIDYVICHELAHLLVPGHGREFNRVMNRLMPLWRLLHEEIREWLVVFAW